MTYADVTVISRAERAGLNLPELRQPLAARSISPSRRCMVTTA